MREYGTTDEAVIAAYHLANHNVTAAMPAAAQRLEREERRRIARTLMDDARARAAKRSGMAQ